VIVPENKVYNLKIPRLTYLSTTRKKKFTTRKKNSWVGAPQNKLIFFA
jgi:hypothetical protein